MTFHKLFRFAALVSLFVVVPGTGFCQSQPPAAAQQPSATTAPPPAPQAQAAPLPNAKPAKVWTNDEIDVLRNNHSVSVVGNRTPQKVSATTSTVHSQEKDPAWYRKQLTPLRAEIDKLDAQIAKFKALLSGENVSDAPTMHMQMTPSPQEQLKQMEAKRQADATKMDDLLDRARHNGVEASALQ
jgi:hypothetical protein